MKIQQLPEGWFSESDIATYRSLYESLPDNAITAEVGVWKGRSICSVADIVKRKNISVYAIDTFQGTESEGDAHKEAKESSIYEQFVSNITAHGIVDSINILTNTSLEAAKILKKKQFDLVFVDADHSTEAVRSDITAWIPMADILCGHDWSWESVRNGITESGYTATELSGNMWRLNEHLLSIVIPTWQGEERVLNLLKSIERNTSKQRMRKMEIVVVNNNPLTQSEYSDKFPMRIRTINEFEKGFGHACNAGAKAAKGRYVLFLNDDCQILDYWGKDLWAEMLCQELGKPSVGVVGVHQLHDSVLNFDFVVGFFFAINRNLFNDMGGFSIYEWGGGEDIELCYLLHCKGYGIVNIGVTDKGEYPIYHEAEGTLHDEEHKDKWVGGIFESNLKKMYEKVKDIKPIPMNLGVTAVVPTRGRYSTTLPMTLCHIACQTILPYEVIVYDDNDEPQDIREWETIGSILRMLEGMGVKWRWQFGAKAGAWVSHQRSIKESETEFIWRVDDDCFPQNDVLEKLLSHMKDGVTAAGGSVLFLGGQKTDKPIGFTNKLAFIDNTPNAQWFVIKEPQKAEHLYSSFMYRKSAAKDLVFPMLSRKSFREETILTAHLSTKGDVVLVPDCITHHAYASGGIRNADGNEKEMFSSDQRMYEGVLRSLFGALPKGKLLVAANGKGDAENLLQYAREQEGVDIMICSVDNCVDVFEGEFETYGAVDAKKLGVNFEKESIYEYMAKMNWKENVLNAYRSFYG